MALCPICKSVAILTPAEKFGDATFVCLNHEEFVVSHIVLGTKALMDAGATRWGLAWLHAKSRGSHPRITTYDF